jgi:hypothetical protein
MRKFMFSIVSNDPDYDFEQNVIEFTEGLEDWDYDLMEGSVDRHLSTGEIPSGMGKVQGVIIVDEEGNTTLESYVVFKGGDIKSFEFGVSLGQVEFVQNFEDDELDENECIDLVEKLMESRLIETEFKTYGYVKWTEGSGIYVVMFRPYVDDWEWDFDHDDTESVIITL